MCKLQRHFFMAQKAPKQSEPGMIHNSLLVIHKRKHEDMGLAFQFNKRPLQHTVFLPIEKDFLE